MIKPAIQDVFLYQPQGEVFYIDFLESAFVIRPANGFPLADDIRMFVSIFLT
jgi:hypothetical protein